MRIAVLAFALTGTAFGGIINPLAVDPSLFNVTTFTTGLRFPTGIQAFADGSIDVLTNPGYYSAPGVVQAFTAAGGTGTPVYTSPATGFLTGTTSVGRYMAVGNDPYVNGNNTITLLQPGATSGSPMTTVATLNMSYSLPWDHNTIGVAARPTPGVAGSYDLIVNVGSKYDAVATPSGDPVTLTGTGFSSFIPTDLKADSLYLIRLDETGAQPAVTAVQQVATGIRNVYGMGFDAGGNFYFSDNAIDALPDGSTPVPGNEPPQADELNFISAADFANGTPPDFGYPNCYIQYSYGGVPGVPVGSGCTQPLLAFQPITDSAGTHELEGPTTLAFAPSSFPGIFNNGVFVGFVGDESPNDESGLAFYNFATHEYVHFIESLNPDIGPIIGIASTSNALFVSEVSTGTVYEITAAAPEPRTLLPALLGMVAILCLRRRQ